MSEILVNKLTGTSTAGSILVTGEGNSTTTNLQQGLAKAWSNFNGTGTIAVRDSNNVASLLDGGSGTYTVNTTNALANVNYCVTGIGDDDTNHNHSFLRSNATITTSACPLTTGTGHHSGTTGGLSIDTAYVNIAILGDLA